MSEYGILILILSVGISATVQIFTDPRITRKFILRSGIVIAMYLAHCAFGVLVLVFIVPHGPSAALGATLAFLGWVGLGMLGLIRFAPRFRTPPAALLRFGLADAICLLLIGFGISSAFGLMP